MSDIAELRAKIDAIDLELLRLLNERASVAREIGVIKSREGLPIYSPEREDRVIRSLIDRSSGPLKPEAIRAIYCEIMSAALALEKDVAAEVAEAVAFAEAGPWEPVEDLTKDVYTAIEATP